ncbi:MAG: hypothetical protein LBF75_04815 [Treponema sp.]|jgi:predicted  nucleic acid-binding Zn-ribbon protein|nr:hypothetical protein [Treponema sp.]
MNIGIELVVSLVTTAVGIGISYATLKVRIDHLEKSDTEYARKEYLLQLHRESTDEQKQLAERIAHEQGVCAEIQKELTTIREDHGTRIARIEEAMVSIKHSMASIEAKLDRLLLR